MTAAAAVSLTFAGGAMARAGDRTLAETYPAATALCVTAHTGTLPPKLAHHKGAVIDACNTLDNAFAPLVSTLDAAEATYLNTVSAQKALVAAACQRPVPLSGRAACVAARATAKSTDAAALSTRRTAVKTYSTSIEANRTAFWNTIQSLRSVN